MWLTADDCDLGDFIALVERDTPLSDYPTATAVVHGAVVYDVAAVRAAERRTVMSEFAHAFAAGPGVVAIRGALDTAVVDRASEVFWEIIGHERREGVGGGDHFAKPGANDRVWNALEKFALRDPAAFVDYYSNDILGLVSTAWLGPGYQVTSQLNVVNPGGAAQQPHRDYHLGFMGIEQSAGYPAHVHRLSPALTLQGAIAHCDMPLASGPTQYLPYSHQYEAGYLATQRADFADYFAEHHMQLELGTGDAVFFNPALFHAAGHNRTADVRRMANLLQVGSAFGRSIEHVDRRAMIDAVYPVLAGRAAGMDVGRVHDCVAAVAEGYPFPADLDVDLPIDGLAPESDAAIMRRALAEGWDHTRLVDALG